jgi:hypothetical protein
MAESDDFDYSTLDAGAAAELRSAAERIRGVLDKNIIAVGHELLTVKARVQPGTFGRWLDTEFGLTRRSSGSLHLRIIFTVQPSHTPPGPDTESIITFRVVALGGPCGGRLCGWLGPIANRGPLVRATPQPPGQPPPALPAVGVRISASAVNIMNARADASLVMVVSFLVMVVSFRET